MIMKYSKVFWICIFSLILRTSSSEEPGSEEDWSVHVSRINSYIDSAIEPCADFYQYACGKWTKSNKKIDSGDVLGLMEVEINKQIRNLLHSVDPKSDGENKAVVKAKYFYQSCVGNTDHKIQSFLDYFEPLKVWNSIKSNDTIEGFDWISAIANLRRYGINVLIEESVLPHWNNSSMNLIYIDKANFSSLQRDYYLNPSLERFLLIYKISVAELFTLLGTNENEAAEIAEGIIDFEQKLAKIMLDNEDNSEEADETVVGYLCQWIPEIDWIKYLSIVLERKVDLHESLIVISPGYLHNLTNLVNKTDTKILLNYFKFRILAYLEDFKNFDKEDCTNILRNRLGHALSAVYVEKYYDQQSIRDVVTMIEQLKSSFYEIINKTTWLDAETKKAAKQKLNAIISSVAINNVQVHKTQSDVYYEDLKVYPDNFYRNYWEVVRHQVRKEQSKLLQVNARFENDKNQAVANAYYLKTKNLVAIPAGLLQIPVFHRNYPKSYNYGVLGTIIGHEMSHGFDYSGKDYDAEGNIRTWWDDETAQRYNERIQCMINQYNNYTRIEFEHLVSGENTISENIADNSGLRLAYNAYMKLDEPEKNVGGLNITNKQLFFLAFAQFFCSEVENTIFRRIFSEHSVDKYRVIGALSNMEEFSKEYNCPLGSPMNPVTKCLLW